MKNITLFCIPYAGGSCFIFNKWEKYMKEYIRLEPIELRGRGRRLNEEFYKNLEEAVDDIFESIKDKILHDDYAICGHSMGGLLAYELYYKLKKENLRLPKHIFFSGYKPPSILREERQLHLLSDEMFIKEIIKLGGTPEEFLNNKKLLDLFIPILRSDFRMIENYKYKCRKDKIQCDISVFNGNQDDISTEEILKWKEHGKKRVKVYEFDGNHFFINNNIRRITNIINETLIL